MSFPKDFVWGAAAASYQVEGATNEGGRGPSVWDMFCRKPGAVKFGHTGDPGAHHYHRYEEDARLMGQIGLQAYRFSIAWPRVMPEGTGAVNEEGLDFYDRLVDALLANGVQPWVTLFHWDYPLALYYRGGWMNEASSDWFADYARIIVDRLSDRVSHWMTLNEIQCFIGLGHLDGVHAPGDKLALKEVLYMGHNALLAHGKAVQVIRANAKSAPQVGWAPTGTVSMAASDDPADIEAARTHFFATNRPHTWTVSWWSDPAMLGHYPEDGLAVFGAAAPEVKAGDMETINQPLDFYGANIYSGNLIKAGPDGEPVEIARKVGYPETHMEWPLTPQALYWGPRFYYERYKTPIVITENGLADIDWIGTDGKCHDPKRIDFTKRYLHALGRAIDNGVEVRGYMHWSIMDNFEWAEGYTKRFGMIYVDYETGERTLKDSAHWYKDVIASGGAKLYEDDIEDENPSY